jgi:UDP-glucose 4-epimerase
MKTAFVTGGSGFLGSLLVSRLLEQGYRVSNIDLVHSDILHPSLTSIVGDIRNRKLLDHLLAQTPHDVVFHCASLLAHGGVTRADLWSSNVEGTRILCEAMAKARVPRLVYTSSNCLWGHGFDRPVTEDDPPAPAEIYGSSKWEAEKILQSFEDQFSTVIIRCPTIIDEGRLGLLAILFEFISEDRRVWVVGDGSNRYQFIYAQDLIDAMLAAAKSSTSQVFGIGSDKVPTMREVYEYVIEKSDSRSRVRSLPKAPALAAMRAAHFLRLSPLGPYHYRMIASDFTFDTTRIKSELGWRPTVTNQEMMYRAFRYYQANRDLVHTRKGVSAHRKPSGMGVIRMLKWMS